MTWWRRLLRRPDTKRVDLSHSCNTRDGVTVQLVGGITYRVASGKRPRRAPADATMAVEQLAVTTLRAAVGELDHTDLGGERARLETTASHVLTEVMDGWGLADVSVTLERIGHDQPDADTTGS